MPAIAKANLYGHLSAEGIRRTIHRAQLNLPRLSELQRGQMRLVIAELQQALAQRKGER
jgi:hypothetical protein